MQIFKLIQSLEFENIILNDFQLKVPKIMT